VHVHALTVPLITKSDGSKFGKTAGGAVWLSADRTTPYAFYQHFIRTDDRDLERFLLQLTLLPVTAVQEVMATHAKAPDERHAQRVLARALTELVHGEAAAAEAERASSDFTRPADERSEAELAALVDEIPTTRIDRSRLEAGVDLIELLAETGVAGSKSDARRALQQRGVYLNDRQLDEAVPVTTAELLHDRYVLLRRGKKQRHIVVVEP
jgi:tyrosyl-tRNA synthetase